jgi:hypothetical protein
MFALGIDRKKARYAMNDACGLPRCAKICHILDVLGLFLALRHTAKLQARITYNMFGSGSKFKGTR